MNEYFLFLQKIREDFVEMRRKNDEVSQMKLHELLVLARYNFFFCHKVHIEN